RLCISPVLPLSPPVRSSDLIPILWNRMTVVRQVGALLLAALSMSRGLFAQDTAAPDTLAAPMVAADQVRVLLRPLELRYVQQEPLLGPRTSSIKALYANAWALGSP